MMGPWAISGSLLLGARLVLYEGAPDHPGPDRLWELVARHRVTHLGSQPDGRPGVDPARRGAGPRPRPAMAPGARFDRRAVGSGQLVVVLPRGRRRALPDRQLLGRDGGRRAASSAATSSTPIKPASFNGPCPGTAADVVDPDGRSASRRCRRARHPGAGAGDDSRLLARPGSLRRDVLEPVPRHVGPRRLGDRRRRWLLVHPGPLRRHAEGRGQARRAGGGRGRGHGPPGGRRGRGDRRPARDQGRDDRRRLHDPARRDGRRRRSGRRSPGGSSRTSARRSSRRRSPWCPRCRRRGRARSCDASSGPPGSAWIPATSRRWMIRRRSTRSAGPARSASAADGARARRTDRPMSVAIDKDIVTWDALADMVADLAARVPKDYDVMLAITRGGLVPAGMLAYRLGIRNILVAAVEYYDDEGQPGPEADVPPVPGRSPPPRPAGPDRRRGLGQRDDDPCGHRAGASGRRPADHGRAPLQADPLPGPGRPGLPRRDDRSLGRLPVQGRQLTGT